MRDIVVGRSKADMEKFGMKGTIFLGKQFITMGRTTTLSNKIYLDVAGAHVVFICGKRGGGKSYTMGVIAEGVSDLEEDVKQNLSFVFFDIMGVYWSMKYPNKKDEDLMNMWGIKGKGLDVKIFTPTKFYHEYKEKGIPTDAPFAIKPSDLNSSDWTKTFGMGPNDPAAILIERVLHNLELIKGKDYTMKDLIEAIQSDTRAPQEVKDNVENRFNSAQRWGVFDEKGTDLSEIAKGGQVTILDVSCYATMPNGWKIKAMITGLIAQHLFIQRMLYRKDEEYKEIHQTISYFSEGDTSKEQQKMPLVWLVIDEAHEMLPRLREDENMATDPLKTIMREGRQPGISLILATQQPGKIHTDVMTQSDTVISHRLTARIDVEALSLLTQSYMREGLSEAIDHMPRVKGAAVVFDDSNERLFPMRVRPRYSWHGGSSPVAVHVKKKINY